MKSVCRNKILISASLAALVAIASAQEAPFIAVHGPHNLEDALREHGVTDQSEQSLISALQDSNQQVRGMAANKLAADGDQDAIPAIVTTLSNEQDLQTQSQLAQALWVLHDPRGVEHLHSMCMNAQLPMHGLLSAVRTLQIIRVSTGECADTFIAAMSRKNESGEIGMAVSMLPVMYREVSPSQARVIFAVIPALFADTKQEPVVRHLAGQALSQIRTPEAAELLRRQIPLETDDTLRRSFQQDLGKLEKEH